MPFKTLTGPRKLNDLGSEVRGTAILLKPGLVAQLSTDPVRLAIQPIDGGGGKITNVSLDGAEDVALLSRDFAVVRTSGGDVWALLDIAHTPKMDQVAREARALCMRPTGESALVLGWDGSATNLTLNRHEVAARPFAVRGSIRACELTETETYAVVDGADGGQLRVHPGATPEPGASLRVNLPLEAAGFDRVRGGAKLSAVYKRGSSTVCLLTGGPNRLTAKLVKLEAKATDIAVSETSLFATFADGRVAVYDGDTITAAGDAPMVPKSTVALGARGEPRTIAITGRGAPMLWIGTSMGEVMTVSVVRKQASI